MTDKRIGILLVDDHQVVRDGLQRMLEQSEELHVVGQSDDAQSTLSQIDTLEPDVVLMDIKMPDMDGIELTRRVKRNHPSCNIIMLTLYDQYITQAMGAGARGYLLKDIKNPELVQAIKKVYGGEIVISESLKAEHEAERIEPPEVIDPESNMMVEELQIVLSPPVEANQLLRLAGRTEEFLNSRVMQMVGAWQEGTIMTVILNRGTLLNDVLNIFKKIPEIEEVTETPHADIISPKLLKKAESMPRIKNRSRKTLFLTLEPTVS